MVFSMVLLMLFATGYIISPKKQRRLLLISALLSTPFSFASVFFVPEYWNPVRIAPFVVGIEDLLFSFSTGGIVWMLATWSLHNYIDTELRLQRTIKRYFIYIVSGTAVNVMLYILGVGVMTATLIGILLVATALFLLRRKFWPLIITGMIGFVIFYFVIIKVIFMLFPAFPPQWTTENLWGFRVWGVPIEEVIWAMVYGAVWPLFMAYVLNVRLMLFQNKRQSQPVRAL
jgi:hypothetical protein